jgi:hypothetical protein
MRPTNAFRRSALACVAAVGVVAAGCSGGGDGDGPAARLTVNGRVEVARGSGAFEPVDTSRTINVGDRLRVVEGSAVLRPGEGEVELRAGSELELRSPADGDGVEPALTAGRALLAADDGTARMMAGTEEVSVTKGAARVERDKGALIAVYRGTGTVAAGGRSLTVPALRQATVSPTGQLADKAVPLVYAPGDEWDQRYLADFIDLGNQLVARSNGFTAQLSPGEGRTLGFYRVLFPALEKEPAFNEASFNAARAPGENLVGLAITVQGTKGSFEERLRSVFAFREEGADWGLVAAEQEVSRAPVVSGVDQAIAQGPKSPAEEPPPPVTTPPAPRRTPTTQAPGPSRSPSTISAGPPTTITPPPPGPPNTVGPAQTGVPLVDNTVNSLVDLLSGLLGGLGK